VPVHTQGSLLDGRYRIVRHLGSGGMASVLLCEDERLGRKVAVKRLHADSPVDVEQRFKREAKLGASLNHPNLVSVFDTATDDEGVLIVMEFVDGEPLSKALRRGPLRPEEVAAMVTDLGDALDHAHAQGVVHRDVKPANVLIRTDGLTKLADLGIAMASDDTRLTRSGTVLGTAAYMAPEQLDGRGAGPPADVYALAAIAYEALSGRRPREGRTPVEIAHSIATEGTPDLRDAWPQAPGAAAEVLKRGMALEPGERPGSAGELARELEVALGEGPAETARHETALTRPLPPPAAPATAAHATPGRAPAPAAPGRTAPATAAPAARRRGRRPSAGAIALAAVFLALAIATIAGAVLSGGDDEGSSPQADREPAERPQADRQEKQKQEPAAEQEEQQPAATPPAEPEEEEQATQDPAGGAELNEQGFTLMNEGRYEEAIPVLEQAVNSFPSGTQDLNYAYALFNLGKSLRLAGRPEEAIEVLEQRLQIPNQRGVVRQELELARQAAGA
jgi:eukaryotic-like serine/threonine-protein kinase